MYLRPLCIEDASVSYKWRNMPKIWLYTKANYKDKITFEVERAWLSDVLKREDQRRFAICLKENDQYIGNVQLLDIKKGSAVFHIVIGEISFWGLGIGQAATKKVMMYAFSDLKLKKVSLQVNADNFAGIAVYRKIGFTEKSQAGDFIIMELSKSRFENLHPCV